MKIEKYSLIEIERSKGASILINKGLEEHIEKLLLIEALPSGDPVDNFVKLFNIDGRKFLSTLKLHKEKDYGLALAIELTDEMLSYSAIGFIEDMRKKLEKKLSKPDTEFQQPLDISFKEQSFDFEEVEGFDEFLYALLADEPIIIVGQPAEMEQFLSSIFMFFPKSKNERVTLSANNTKIDPNVLINCLIETDDVLKILDEKVGKYTILYLPYKKVFGRSTSPLSKELAICFNNKDKEKIEKVVNEFLKKILSTREIENPADVLDKYQMHLADVKLMMIIRAHIFKLELPKHVLEE